MSCTLFKIQILVFLFLKPVVNLSCLIGPGSFMWHVNRVIIFSWDRPCLQLFFWLSYSQKLPSLDYKLCGDPLSEAFHDLTPVYCSSFSFWHCSLPNSPFDIAPYLIVSVNYLSFPKGISYIFFCICYSPCLAWPLPLFASFFPY